MYWNILLHHNFPSRLHAIVSARLIIPRLVFISASCKYGGKADSWCSECRRKDKLLLNESTRKNTITCRGWGAILSTLYWLQLGCSFSFTLSCCIWKFWSSSWISWRRGKGLHHWGDCSKCEEFSVCLVDSFYYIIWCLIHAVVGKLWIYASSYREVYRLVTKVSFWWLETQQ